MSGSHHCAYNNNNISGTGVFVFLYIGNTDCAYGLDLLWQFSCFLFTVLNGLPVWMRHSVVQHSKRRGVFMEWAELSIPRELGGDLGFASGKLL
jgi:hypothetical protein